MFNLMCNKNQDRPSTPPVLLLTFNRPNLTAQVLDAVREARPRRLFVASDGPRPNAPSDEASVQSTRALIDEAVNWPCEVLTRYLDINQGCRAGVASAVTWFFEHVEEGIILEDDCVPHLDFFCYCRALLDRYRYESQVMAIAGDNSAALEASEQGASYAFVSQPLVWGWATWRRAWEHYDDSLEGWRSIRSDRSAQRRIWPDPVERRWQSRNLDRLLFSNRPDSWAYRWAFSVASRGGLCAVPAVNLVRNVGFGPEGTHTRDPKNSRANRPTSSILPLIHPNRIKRDEQAERQIFDRVHRGSVRRNLFHRTRAVVFGAASLIAEPFRRRSMVGE